MHTNLTDAELLAWLDELLPAERMVRIEAELRSSAPLRDRAANLLRQRDQGHTVSEIWRRERLSCPTRHQLGSYLLGVLNPDLEDYIYFHVRTVGCRYCAANIADLEQSRQSSADTHQRREKFFQSSAGYVRKLPSSK